jgi:hypothetical protein
MRRSENEIFTISLYKIDCILEERYQESEEYQAKKQRKQRKEELYN